MKKNKINILFVLPNFDTGGSEKLVFDIIKHIDKEIFNPVLCVFFSGVYEAEFLKLKIPFYVVHPSGKIKSKLKIVKFLNNIVSSHKIQIVNTHHTSPLMQGLISYKLFNKCIVVHTEHTRLDLDPNVTPRILVLQKFFMKFVDVALGISQGVCDYFKKELFVPNHKIVKILNGVAIDKFTFKNEEALKLKTTYRSNLEIEENIILIGLFANFRKQKNHKSLVEAANIIKKEGTTNFKIIFAGNGDEENTIKELVTNLQLNNLIIFLGPRLDIPELMNVIDIYCLPSFFEGLPFSLMEAMAAGKAIVATDVVGNNEIAIHNKNALLVESDKPDQLAKCLQELIINKELRQQLEINSKEYSKKLSFKNMMKEYESLFIERLSK